MTIEPETPPEQKFKAWLMAFYKLKTHGFMTEKEKQNIFKRICKAINESGYEVIPIGFYEFEFKKIDKH